MNASTAPRGSSAPVVLTALAGIALGDGFVEGAEWPHAARTTRRETTAINLAFVARRATNAKFLFEAREASASRGAFHSPGLFTSSFSVVDVSPAVDKQGRTGMPRQRLYINIDHVATLRQARRGREPDPVGAATLCEQAGADGITAHLREDRRHIQDDDIARLGTSVTTVLNLEMACTDEMIEIALRLRPHQVTLVPERRQEITTEGGLDVTHDTRRIGSGLERLNGSGIRTSLFIDPTVDAVERSRALGAVAIELHTGQ